MYLYKQNVLILKKKPFGICVEKQCVFQTSFLLFFLPSSPSLCSLLSCCILHFRELLIKMSFLCPLVQGLLGKSS